MIGVVGARELPAQPSEEEFRFALRSGLILCYAINKASRELCLRWLKVHVLNGAPLSVFQFLETVRHFLRQLETLDAQRAGLEDLLKDMK